MTYRNWIYALVALLPAGPGGTGPAVVGLDDEGVLLLLLAVDGATGPQHAFARRSVQHLCLEGRLLAVDLKGADFSCKERGGTMIQGKTHTGAGGRTNGPFSSACISTSHHRV